MCTVQKMKNVAMRDSLVPQVSVIFSGPDKGIRKAFSLTDIFLRQEGGIEEGVAEEGLEETSSKRSPLVGKDD